ncbi:hypothetical protein [Streptomyces aidingensis]|uniref:Uncharacterized protein n=1 Tax=Streptomyces aidingensis TaxID=910347 RepID=A0A1I1KMB1_9ACTN|nr:hypothetical protein [Streptomyces aidingensis]SFC61705.1 hypothetical protein SAMN05421773_104287 [Streptomyces aidingensis]
MLTTYAPGRIPHLLRKALGPRWEITTAGNHLEIHHPDAGTPYHPPRRPLNWRDLLALLEHSFAGQGVPRAECLPLRWGRDTELTISAVQALDPLLKDGRPTTHRHGFLPQPVVRFTGQRDEKGDLRDGFLTSFVNVSRVEPINDISEYAEILDGWLTVLSGLGMHARHISIHGRLDVWRRRQVEGITLRFRHLDLALGDIVLIWNTQTPDRMAVDLGTALERLAWARSRRPWPDLIFGSMAQTASTTVLDAIRTATLLLGSGITPAARGAGSITRRVIATIPASASPLGLSAAVRTSHEYWSLVSPLIAPWADVTDSIEQELSRHRPGIS